MTRKRVHVRRHRSRCSTIGKGKAGKRTSFEDNDSFQTGKLSRVNVHDLELSDEVLQGSDVTLCLGN